jgi:C1A family cysteine protease
MLKKLKRNLTIMVVVCLITVVAVIAPFYSNASSVEPTATIDIEKVNKEFLEVDPATAAVDSDEDISVELLEETLATDVVELEDTNEVLSYLVNPSKIKELKIFRPSSVDNSESKYFPKIMDQGTLNSCTTWSTVYYQMSYAVNKALDRDASSTDNVFSPSWIYTMVNEGENLGNYYADILKILSEIGAVPLSKVPAISEVEGDNIRNIKADKELWLEASKYKVDEYYSIDLKRESKTPVIDSPKDKDLDAIKKALALGEVLTGTTYSYKWNKAKIQADTRVKENAKYEGQYIVTDCTGKMKGAHRITIVGYNDNIWVDINGDNVVDKGEKGAFKIANSYGENKDNKGFAWMSYDAVNAVSCLTKEGEQVDADRDA